jgi:membrane-associated phospholipid phosphatase
LTGLILPHKNINIQLDLDMRNARIPFLKYILVTTFVFIFSYHFKQVYAKNDSIQFLHQRQPPIFNEILPLSLVGIGTALNFSNFRYFIKSKIGNTTHITLDNYLQFAPIAELYVVDMTGVKPKNSLWDQTKYLAISELITEALIQSVKRVANVKRPNGGTMSFPSGHTAVAFASATVLFEEFKDENLFAAFSGYGFSTATGILRITNNFHWISDVLVAAGTGILVTHLIYFWEPLKNWKPLLIRKKIQVTPGIAFSNQYTSLSLRFQL